MVFLPETHGHYASRVRKQINELSELTEEASLITMLMLIGRQLTGL